eukprot:TRINITY_DN12238_c0_g2_i1.p1 TRINITY_DN12238_c0_g2~~TRINITY_DN12238_c0_g2_i1.p1  ORF type:complete len:866 (-),score=135.56 TRINITY_DN12238_c0_g2_i1:122-2719(-)
MGHGLSVDQDALELKDLLSFGQVPAHRSGGPFLDGAARQHIKAWKFEKSGRAVVDAPVPLCDENGKFGVELSRSCSYLILHVHASDAVASTNCGGDGGIDVVTATALQELAGRAVGICTPRGLGVEVVSQCEATVNDGNYSAGSGPKYAVFVWHGVGVDPHVKARVFTKAFELERLLRLGLLWRPGFLEALDRAVLVRGVTGRPGDDTSGRLPRVGVKGSDRLDHSGNPAGGATGRSFSGGVNASFAAAASARQNGNRLMTMVLESIPQVSTGGPISGGAGGGTAGGTGPRFPRLGVSVCRSLGVTPSLGSAWTTSRRPSTIGKFNGAAAAIAAIPRLQLGSGSGSVASQEGDGGMMDVDDSACDTQLDSAGRKRYRWPPETVRTSRNGLPGNRTTTNSGSMMVPKSARTDACTAANAGNGFHAASYGFGQKQMPPLNLTAVNGPRHSPSNRTDGPSMLNLEEINMSEEELINSYDPENQENNYHLPPHLYKQLQLKQFRAVCSEIVEKQVYLSGYQVAKDCDLMRRHGITHIVNTAADVCESQFPEHFTYLTYYLKDTNNEDISVLFYRTMEFIQSAVSRGGRVLVHCREGVSRSSTMVIAYIMWRFNIPFETAHERIRKVRSVCWPNTGFTCQLLVHGKKLGVSNQGGPQHQLDTLKTHRVVVHHPKEPYMMLVPASSSTSWPVFDNRFGWALQRGTQFVGWIGSQVVDKEGTKQAFVQHLRWIETFERIRCSLTICWEGCETHELWQALGLQSPYPTAEAAKGLTAPRACFDADYEVSLVASARSMAIASGTPIPAMADERHAQAAAQKAWDARMAAAAAVSPKVQPSQTTPRVISHDTLSNSCGFRDLGSANNDSPLTADI